MPPPTITTEEFATSLITNTPKPLTGFRSALQSVVNSVPNTLNLKECNLNEEIISGFNDVCREKIVAVLREHLFENPALELLKKSDFTSDLFRTRGNEYYKRKRVREALRCYTLAAAFACSNSRSAALAYSNRSACFYESGQLSSSLDDINLFESIYPDPDDNVATRVRERKQKCVEKLSCVEEKAVEKNFCSDFFKLERANDTIPSAESFIAIRNDEMRGRHVVNAGDSAIPPGRLIILERPFSHVLLNTYSFEYKHCTTCLKDLNGAGIPCNSCVFAVYCSSECAQPSSTHPQRECQISSYLYELKPSRTVTLSLSALLLVQPETLLHSNTDPSSPPGFINGKYISSEYEPIRNLIYHKQILSQRDLIARSGYSTTLAEILDHENTFQNDSEKLAFSTLMLVHQMNLPCNAHSLYKLTSNTVNSEYSEIGAGAFALLSLINHSCDPNVVRITLPNGVNGVVTLHHIPPNGEILDNYGMHFATDKMETRKSHASDFYNFPCDCDACSEDWPMIDKLMKQTEDKDDTEKGAEAMRCYESASESLESDPVSGYEQSRDALDYFDLRYKKPCALVCVSQEYMKQALFLITRCLFERK